MSTPPEPLTDFDDLRRVAIEYAQQASGEIWTDYNLHDPGVTLLEQTCFALSQIAYQVGLPTRDLLTNPRGHFCFNDLGLFAPRKVLNTMPVTCDDLSAWLCTCPQINSVSIITPGAEGQGLYDITIVPAQDAGSDDRAFRRAFAAARPLGRDLGRLEMAKPIEVVLRGHIEITSETLPETTAAALYYSVAQILSGADHTATAATRADVWDAPERLLAPAQNRAAPTLKLGAHLATLRALPGVRDIGDLALLERSLRPKGDTAAIYFQSVLPTTSAEIGISLTLDGAPVTLDPARIQDEYIRIKALAIAQASHHIDAPDWDVLKAGRRRRFTQSNVDNLLPVLYRAKDYRLQDQTSLMAEYRSAIDIVLREMVSDLDALPRIFTARPRQQSDDPVRHRLRIDLLDYLIALQGAEMPATRHSGLHRYHTARARHRFEITWRLEYLFALPALHAARASGPGPDTPGGFLAELALLADLGLSEDGALNDTLHAYGLRLDDKASLMTDPDAQETLLVAAVNPFDMLVPEAEDADLLSPEALAELSPFLDAGTLSPALLAHLSASDSFVVAPYPGAWQVLFDPGPLGAPRRIAVIRDKAEARETVARLRTTWRHLNHSAEAAHLIEHVHLRAAGTGYDANMADLILPGWTARCQMESYRSYVAGLVTDLAPAHMHVRVQWLSFDQITRFCGLKQAAHVGDAEALNTLKAFLDAQHGLPATAGVA